MKIEDITPGRFVVTTRRSMYSGDSRVVREDDVRAGKNGVLAKVIAVGRYRMQIQGACGARVPVLSDHAATGVVLEVQTLDYVNTRAGVPQFELQPDAMWTTVIVSPRSVFSRELFFETRADMLHAKDELKMMTDKIDELDRRVATYAAVAVMKAIKTGLVFVVCDYAGDGTIPKRVELRPHEPAAQSVESLLSASERAAYRKAVTELEVEVKRLSECKART